MAKPTPRHKKMYNDSPKIGKDENGKAVMTKGAEKSAEDNSGTDGEMGEESQQGGIAPHAKHAMERMALHGKHEQEHFAHDHAKSGDKSDMHKRHQMEMKDLHKRHQAEGK